MAFFKLTILSSLLLLSSCATNEPQLTKEQLLAGVDSFGKTYQINRIEIDLGTVNPNICVTDNYITYYPSGRYEINEGASKCNPTDPPAVIGSWSLNEGQNTLKVSIADSTQFWFIESLDENAHSISSAFREGNRTYSFHSSN